MASGPYGVYGQAEIVSPARIRYIGQDLTWDDVKVIRGGTVRPASGVTLTIGSFHEQPGPYQWIDLSAGGTVAFTGAVDALRPEWWGADGDDTTDVTTEFQAAATAAASRSLVLSAGRSYRITTCALPSGIEISGGGTVKFVVTEDDTNLFTASGKTGIRFRGITIDGEKASHSVSAGFGRLISLATCTDVKVEGCAFVDAIRYPIQMTACTGCRVVDNSFDNCYYAAHLGALSGDNVLNVNTIINGEDRGFFIHNSSGNSITGNRVEITTSAGAFIGIEVFADSGGVASHNTVTGNTVEGARISIGGSATAEHNTVTGNTVKDAPAMGIEVANADFTSVSGNTVSGAGGAGIDAVASSHVAISGNVVDAPGEDGIRVYADATNTTANGGTISGNVITNVTGTYRGVRLYNNGGTSVEGWAITGNVIDGVVDRGIILSNSDDNIVSGNVLRNITHATKIDTTSGTSSGNVLGVNHGFLEATAAGTGSIADAATGSFNITVAGSLVNDLVQVTPTTDMGAAQTTGVISTAGTARITVQNFSGGSIDTSAFDFHVRVTR